MHAWGETTLGMVTGANKYFALSPARVRELRLPETDLVALSPPGSRHLRGLSFTAQLRARLGDAGASTWMFRPSAEPGLPSWEYIRRGADLGIGQAYKCRVRTPWWRVPLQAPADLFLTYMNADTARLTTNVASVHHLNSVHGVYLHGPTVELGRLLLPLASLNSVTLLSAETVGRAYGGGMLKVEPREADALPMPIAAHRRRRPVRTAGCTRACHRTPQGGTTDGRRAHRRPRPAPDDAGHGAIGRERA